MRAGHPVEPAHAVADLVAERVGGADDHAAARRRLRHVVDGAGVGGVPGRRRRTSRRRGVRVVRLQRERACGPTLPALVRTGAGQCRPPDARDAPPPPPPSEAGRCSCEPGGRGPSRKLFSRGLRRKSGQASRRACSPTRPAAAPRAASRSTSSAGSARAGPVPKEKGGRARRERLRTVTSSACRRGGGGAHRDRAGRAHRARDARRSVRPRAARPRLGGRAGGGNRRARPRRRRSRRRACVAQERIS